MAGQPAKTQPSNPPGQLGLSFGTSLPDCAPETDTTVTAKTRSKTDAPRRANAPSAPAAQPAPSPAQGQPAKRKKRASVTAETMAKQQREISVSEFFTKNRHLLGFDNKRKALLTTVKEAVDNSLDACEEAGILPELSVRIQQTDEDRFRVIVRDNGPGIVKQQIPNVFGKLLYGSKFHRLKMSRGQQGIGISAAGMYGLITTGKPVRIISRTSARTQAHQYRLAIDTRKNKPDIISDEPAEVPWSHGTEVAIELVGSHQRGRQSVDEYLHLVAIANPHATIVYTPPGGQPIEYPRSHDELPGETREIKPHPYGIELGTLMKMLRHSQASKLGAFLKTEFCRISDKTARTVATTAGLTPQTWTSSLTPPVIERLYQTLQNTRIMAPPTNCLAPIGAEAILRGLLTGIKAEFYTAVTRDPAVYRGNPFQIEVGIAYGGELGRDRSETNGDDPKDNNDAQTRVIRFANRVPLLYQQSACCTFKAVLETSWNKYGLSQSRGALPRAPMVVLVHMASVWVPFTSEGKEAIADYDEIRKEIRLAISEAGRRLGRLLRRKRKRADFARRRDVFTRYIDEVVSAVNSISPLDVKTLRENLLELAATHTDAADIQLDDRGRVVPRTSADVRLSLDDTLIVDRTNKDEPALLFDAEPGKTPGRTGRTTARKAPRTRGAKSGKKRAKKK